MTDRYRAVVFDYTEADLELFDANEKAKANRPPPRQRPIRRRKKKPQAKPPPPPPLAITIKVGRGWFGHGAIVAASMAAQRFATEDQAWRSFDAWLIEHHPGAGRPSTARIIKRGAKCGSR